MSKTATIVRREFLSRVKKKTFLVMTLLGPVLMAAIIIVPVVVTQLSDSDYAVGIVDDSSLFADSFDDTDELSFTPLGTSIDQALNLMHEDRFDAIL
ncbi:MAG: hypothetical protein ACQESL_05860, partial [Bacteroidota bacterium]